MKAVNTIPHHQRPAQGRWPFEFKVVVNMCMLNYWKEKKKLVNKMKYFIVC